MTSSTILDYAPPKKVPPRKQGVLNDIIWNEAGKGVLKFISEQVDLDRVGVLLLSTSGKQTSNLNAEGEIRAIIDLEIINNQPYKLNDFFKKVNSELPDAGIYIGCLESNSSRKERIFKKYPESIAKLIWFVDFVFKRILPKLTYTKRVYNFIFRNRKHVLSKAEALGRLSYTGFEIIGHELINNRFYFSVIKAGEPLTGHKPSGGLLYKMPRISKKGKIVGIYKIRSMYPYSEYLQDYVVSMNGYNEVGKPNNDFRLTRWGKIIRRLHLDELPQLLNVMKFELNLVGVRPISKFGFEALPADLQKNRLRYKPGCIPPNVSLGMTGFDGVVEAERIYLKERRKYGRIVNIKYFWKAISNILRRKNESS